MSVRVVLNLLEKFTNTRALSVLHNRMWQSKNSEVNIHLVHLLLLVTLLVTCVTANNGCPRSIMFCFVSNVEVRAFTRWTCLVGTMCVTCVKANNVCLRSVMFWQLLHPKSVFRSPENGTFFLRLARDLSWQTTSFQVLFFDLGLDLVGEIGNYYIVEQLVFLVVEQLLNPILSSTHVSGKSLEEDEVTHILSRLRLLQFPSENFRDTTSWECAIEDDCVRSCLIKLKSFLLRTIDVDPERNKLSRKWLLSVYFLKIDLEVSIPNWWWNVSWLHIRHDKCTGRSCSE